MLPYWISLALSIVFLFASRLQTAPQIGVTSSPDTPKVSYAKWGVIASALVFIALTGFRYGIGQDYFYTYVPYFDQVRLGFSPHGMEVGYYALNWIVSRFSNDPTPVFLVCSLIFFFCTYSTILRESSCVPMSVFLLFGMSYIFIFMNAMRQMTAVSILFFSLRYIEDRKVVPFLLCVVVASLFHASSLIFCIMYWLLRIRVTLAICCLVPLLVLLLRGPISEFMIWVIGQTSYAGYIGSIFDTGETGPINALMNVIILLFSAVVPWMTKKGYSSRYNLFLICQLLCTAIALITGAIPLAQRVRWLFVLPSVLLIPDALNCIDNKGIRFLTELSIVLLYIIYIYITIGLWNGNGVVPYQSVFFRVS